MSDNQEDENCRIHGFKRNNYFYGKLMTVRDFKDEQKYFNEKRYLINRLIHGSGLVCGLFENDISFPDSGENVRIKFNNDGLVLDCCGREIAIPCDTENGSHEIIIEERLKDGDRKYLTKSDVPDPDSEPDSKQDRGYLYLRYQPCCDERVAAATNSSGCTEEVSESNRIEERFNIIFSKTSPSKGSLVTAPDCKEFFKEVNSQNAHEKIREWIEKIALCPSCNQKDKKVFLACIKKNGSKVIIDSEKTRDLTSLVLNNRLLSELLICHISNFDNPHKTTAQQVGAPVSIDGVSNPGGDIDLEGENTININSDDKNNKITIGETHSGLMGNPHETKHEQLHDIKEVDPTDNDKAKDKHVSNDDAKKWNSSISNINNIGPDSAGNFALNEGNNISITSDTNGVTIASKHNGGGVECFTGVVIFRNIQPGASYNSREIKPDKKTLGFILGIEMEERIITGARLRETDVSLKSIQSIHSGNFIINIENQSENDIPELRVRWWAITPKEMGEDEVTPPGQVNILPKNVILAPRDKQEFIAAVTGSEDVKINWGPKELIEGNILSEVGPNKAIFTAPKNPGKYRIVATSDADQSKRDETIAKVYLFSWNDVPGKDEENLIELLNKKFGISWAKTAKIEKTDDGRTIIVSTGKNSLSLELNDKENKVTLKIEDHTYEKFLIKEENNKINIYPEKDDIQDRIQKTLRDHKRQK
ncbi:MAG: hypothetical protein WA130_10020 [Candidatus Methanoperedens sp.]